MRAGGQAAALPSGPHRARERDELEREHLVIGRQGRRDHEQRRPQEGALHGRARIPRARALRPGVGADALAARVRRQRQHARDLGRPVRTRLILRPLLPPASPPSGAQSYCLYTRCVWASFTTTAIGVRHALPDRGGVGSPLHPLPAPGVASLFLSLHGARRCHSAGRWPRSATVAASVHRRGSEPEYVLTAHRAAVKAIAWCPSQRKLLASGGGASDHHVRFWDTGVGTQVNAIDAKSQVRCGGHTLSTVSASAPLPCTAAAALQPRGRSRPGAEATRALQVCSLLWNPHEKEVLAGLGHSENQLSLWRYPSCQLATELRSHSSRVLHMTLSPDGCTVCRCVRRAPLRAPACVHPSASSCSLVRCMAAVHADARHLRPRR